MPGTADKFTQSLLWPGMTRWGIGGIARLLCRSALDRAQPFLRRFRLHPGKLRQLMPKPGELALGVVSGVGLAKRRCLLKADRSPKVADQRRYAVRLHRRQERVELSLREPSHFFQRAALEHRIKTRINSRIEQIAVGCEKQCAECVRR